MPGPHTPLDQPMYGCTFGEGARRLVRKAFVVRGRASQSELWWGFLVTSIVQIVLAIVFVFGVFGLTFGLIASTVEAASSSSPSGFAGAAFAPFAMLFAYGLFFVLMAVTSVPLYTLTARRLHDAGLSGWLTLINLAVGGYFTIAAGFIPTSMAGLRYEQGTASPVVLPTATVPYMQQAPQAWGPQSAGGWVQPAPQQWSADAQGQWSATAQHVPQPQQPQA